MPEVTSPDGIRLHVEVDGDGEPVTVFAHGLTNSCLELAAFTPFAPGTKVRFCFRGHGHSEVAAVGSYRFADYAADLAAVADAYRATRAVGTSLGAGALAHLLVERPDRFERLVFLLPAVLDEPMPPHPMSIRIAELLETLPKDEAIAQIMVEAGREADYERMPGLRDFDLLQWEVLDPVGTARAIREIQGQRAIEDRAALAAITAPSLIIAREGDRLHPATLARRLAEALPDGELVMLASEADLMAQIPVLVGRVSSFLV